MSGDQLLTKNFLVPDNLAEVLEENSLQKELFTKTITITTNGQEIQSKLNPNAQEFVPSFKQKQSQVLKEDSTVNVLRNEELFPMEDKENKQELIKGRLDLLVEQFYQDFADTSMINACINENIDIEDVFETLKTVEEEENNEKKLVNKLDESARKDELFVLFEKTSEVVNTSSETVGSIAPVFITENLKIENKEVNHEFCKHENNKLSRDEQVYQEINREVENFNQQSRSKEKSPLNKDAKNNTTNLNDKPLTKKELGTINLNCKRDIAENKNARDEHLPKVNREVEKVKNPLNKDAKSNTTSLDDKPQNKKELGTINLKCKGDIAEKKNANKSNKICSKQNNISRELKDTKKIINANEKISKLPTTNNAHHSHDKNANKNRQPSNANTGRAVTTAAVIKKVNFAKNTQITELKNETRLKEESTVNRSSKLSTISKNNTATRTNTNSKSNPLTSKKPPSTRPCKMEVSKSLNKETSSSSTEKSLSSNRSTEYRIYNKPKASEKPLGQKLLAKEFVVNPPRVTVTSQLRKAEARKRQNLFFDLDSIKTSDFLFK